MAFVSLNYDINQYNDFSTFPNEGELNNLYLDLSNYKAYIWDFTVLSFVYFKSLDPNSITSAAAATELEGGTLQIATQAETNAGTDNTKAITPLKLANFAGLGGAAIPFTPEKTPLLGSDVGAWVGRSLGAAYINKILQIRINKASNQLKMAGVRRAGSLLDFSFNIRSGNSYFEVLADASGEIEIFSDSLDCIFWITGTK